MIQVGPSKAHGSYKGKKKPRGSEAVAGDVTWTQGSEKGTVGRDRSKDAELLALMVEEGRGPRHKECAASRSWKRQGKDSSPKPPEGTL